jgi:hypothetical protein
MIAQLPTNELTSDRLIQLIEQLHLGESVTLVDTSGRPRAVIVGVSSSTEENKSELNWIASWEELAQKIGEAWQSDKSALEILTEMRR